MPIYVYQCKECGYVFEEMKSIKESDEKVKCPNCGGETEKLFTPPTIIFKGEGWYASNKKSFPEKMADKYDQLGGD